MNINRILTSAMSPEKNTSNDDVVVNMDDMVAMEELHDAEMGVIEMETAIDMTENAIVGLESLSDAVAVCQTNGGMDAQSAALLAAAAATVMAPFGGSDALMEMPAQEAYEGDGGRAAATEFAMEGLKASIAKMWNAIKDMFKRAWVAIQDWFSKAMTNLPNMKKAAESLSKKAADSDGVPGGDKLKVASAEYLYTGSDAVGLTAKGIKDAVSFSNKINVSDYSNDVVLNLIADGKLDSAEAVKTFVTGMTADITKVNASPSGKEVTGDSRLTDKKAKYYMNGDSMPGNAMSVVCIKAEDKLAVVSFARPVSDKETAKITMKGLDSGKISEVCDAIAGSIDTVIKMEAEMKKVDAKLKLVAKAGDNISKQTKDDDNTEKKNAITDAISICNTMSANVRKPFSDYSHYITKLLSASLSFCNVSYKNLETAK